MRPRSRYVSIVVKLVGKLVVKLILQQEDEYEKYALEIQVCQYLYFCTRKARKLSKVMRLRSRGCRT
jgi:hypothetical protein